MSKRAHWNSIAAPGFDLAAIRQRLTEAVVDAATGSAAERGEERKSGGNEQVVVGGEGSSLTINWRILAVLLATSADDGGVEGCGTKYGNVSVGV